MRIATHIISITTSIITMLVLILVSVWFLLTPIYICVEYSMPYFPSDPYGMSDDERFEHADVARKYLVYSQDRSVLEDENSPDGTDFYNSREISHMIDVQKVLDKTKVILFAGFLVLSGLAFLYWRKDQINIWLIDVRKGAILTLLLIVSIFLGIAISFNSVFVYFHQIFFEGGTWLFRYTDSLIRLFPEIFWRDAFIWVGGISIALSMVTLFIVNKFLKSN